LGAPPRVAATFRQVGGLRCVVTRLLGIGVKELAGQVLQFVELGRNRLPPIAE